MALRALVTLQTLTVGVAQPTETFTPGSATVQTVEDGKATVQSLETSGGNS
jgi:hypothetical protein